VRSEVFLSMKNSMTPFGIELATFWFGDVTYVNYAMGSIKSSRADSGGSRLWKSPKVSGIGSVPIYIQSLKLCRTFTFSRGCLLRPHLESVPETLHNFHTFTRLSAREDLPNSIAAKTSRHTGHGQFNTDDNASLFWSLEVRTYPLRNIWLNDEVRVILPSSASRVSTFVSTFVTLRIYACWKAFRVQTEMLYRVSQEERT
jgi:hypothetical protein